LQVERPAGKVAGMPSKKGEGQCSSLKVDRSDGLTVMTITPKPLTREQVKQKRAGLLHQKSQLLEQAAELDRQIIEIDEWLVSQPEER
jgi:hypothetical protein